MTLTGCSGPLSKKCGDKAIDLTIKVHIIGYAAACFTTFSLLPQIVRMWRLKAAKDVSLFMPLMVAVGSVLWLVYGFLIASPPVIAANGVALIIAVITVLFAVRYRRKQAP